MSRVRIGTRVSIDGLRGVVVGHRPQGMVDIRVDGQDFIARKRESSLQRLNPQNGSAPLRVRREVEQMLHDPPPSWKALYRRAGLPAKPSVEAFIDIVRSKTPSGRSAEMHYGRTMGEGQHVPTKAVREAALLGLRLSYDNNYTSTSGVGLARAVQLVLEPSIDDLAKTRMRAYLTRHEKDKQGKNFGNLDRPSNGYMAWLNWGGDPAKEWLNMRNNPAGRKPDVLKKQDEQFRAVVQGIYETLMAKRLGVKSIYTTTGRRRDVAAVQSGKLSQAEARAILGRAFAIATRQGQKHGYLIPGSQQPTAKGRRRAYKRYEDPELMAQNEQDYEMTLALGRKSGGLRIVARGRGARRRFHVEPQMPGINPEGYKSESAAKAAVTRLRRNPSDIEDFTNAVDGNPDTPTLGQMWDDFDDWVDENTLAQMHSAAQFNADLRFRLIDSYLRQGLNQTQAQEAAARAFMDHGAMDRSEKMDAAVEAMVRRLAPDLLTRSGTRSLSALWSDYTEWLKETPKSRHKYAPRYHGPLINALVEKHRRRGLTPVQAKEAAAREFEDYNIKVELPEQVSLDAAEAFILQLAPQLRRGWQQVTPEQAARERAVARALQSGRSVVPRTVGQSDVGGREFVADVRRGKEEAARRAAGKAKGKSKAGIGRAGVGIGDLSRKGRAAEDTTFTAPPGFEGANYPVVVGQDDDGNTVPFSGNISYAIAEPSGNMTLHYSEGETYRFLPLGVPKDLENRIYGASSVDEANEIMALMGRSPLGLKQMYQDKEGRISISPLTPERLQAVLNMSPERNFQQLAKDIVNYGYRRREGEQWDRPVVAFTTVKTYDERLGKPVEFQTYVVYGFGGNAQRVSAALNRAQKTVRKKKQWKPWKEAMGTYGAPQGTWNTRASHKVFGSSGKYFIVGPLVGQGMTQRGQKDYVQNLRMFANLPEELQKRFLPDLRAATPPVFYYDTKKEAETVRKRLDKKLGKKRVQISDTKGATYAYYIDPERAGDDGGYGVAVAAANELRAEHPTPPEGAVAAGRRTVLRQTMRAGAIQRELSDAIEIIRARFNEVAAQGTAAVNAAAATNDAVEGARLLDISQRMTKLAKQVERAKALTTKEEMEQALESIYDQLERIEDQI